jgi:hypothetical protein
LQLVLSAYGIEGHTKETHIIQQTCPNILVTDL